MTASKEQRALDRAEQAFADAGQALLAAANRFQLAWRELLWIRNDLGKALETRTEKSGVTALREVLGAIRTPEDERLALDRIREIVARMK